MERYSASYGKTNSNFVFQNIFGENVQSKYYSVFCIIENILQRGMPTKPSKYLIENLGDLNINHEEWLPLFSKEKNQWIKRVKGYNENNPAIEFINELLPNYLSEYYFVQQLILPETPFEEIDSSLKNSYYENYVDFYLPQARLVVEIDGSQHKEIIQETKDKQRNDDLNKLGIKTIRIDVNQIKNKNKEFIEELDEIISVIKNSEQIKNYKKYVDINQKTKSEKLRIKYDTVIRFQKLILSLLRKNLISLDEAVWEFEFIRLDKELFELFTVASEDLFIWLSHLCKLQKITFKKPDVVIKKHERNSKTIGIVIDFDIYKRWTDEADLNRNIIYIRNDYFDYDYIDYFEISSTDSFTYDLNFEGEDSDLNSLLFLLYNLFEFKSFRDGQLEIIINVLRRNDTIGILPTGSGKSLCYQYAALLQPCISFVVCPIISLMYDQKENLDNMGINRTQYISSEMDPKTKEEVLNNFENGKYLFIWISPERFQTEKFRLKLEEINQNKNFALAIIDEVHCLSEWGHDFRTSYLALTNVIRKYCPETRLLGLTATASQNVLFDLMKEFEIDEHNIKTTGLMNRKELKFHLIKVEGSKYNELLKLFDNINKKNDNNVFELNGNQTKSGLIFTVNKKNWDKEGCIDIAKKLSKDLKIDVKIYHAELQSETKRRNQNDFKNNLIPVLAATKAFGMGIDKPNIRYTIHFGLPMSIESFYQEAGRSGRDGETADCYIIYKAENCDKNILKKIFDINTDIEEIDELDKNLHYDLNRVLYLWKINNPGVPKELDVMRWVMTELKTENNSLSCSKEHNKDIVEKALYRLTWLGLVKDWTIEKWDKESGIIKVDKDEYTNDSIREKLLNNIRKYDKNFSSESKKYSRYFDVLEDESIKNLATRYMKLLLLWTYDNIVYQRRQAIKNMMDICDNFTNSDNLKNYVENYFKFSNSTLDLDKISLNPNNYQLWFNILFQDEKQSISISKKSADSLIPSLQRYLESYRYNCGLNFISGIIRLITNDFENTDGRIRLEDAFNTIDSFNSDELDDIIIKTLNIGKNCDNNEKELLGEFLVQRYPERANQIYNSIEDNASLLFIINNSLKTINTIKEFVSW